jgi:metal-sulfur cluster biosynthetic enzyme
VQKNIKESIVESLEKVIPLGIQLAFNIKKAVESVEGVEEVDIKVIDYIRAEELNKMLRKAQHQEK